MALLLGRGGRPRRLVPPPRGPLAPAAPRSARAGKRALGRTVAVRARATANRRPGAVDRSPRTRLGGRPLRRHRPVPEPRADVGVRDLLARCTGTLGRVRERVAGTLALACARGRVRLAPGARGTRGDAARRVPGTPGALSGCPRPPRVRLPRARLRRSCKPSLTRVRHRALHIHCSLRDGRLRPREVGTARRGVRGALRVLRTDRAVLRQ